MAKKKGNTLKIIAIVILALVAIPFVLPKAFFKERLIAFVYDRTGRILTIESDIGIQLLPQLEVSVGRATLSNAEGAADEHMIEMDGLDAGLDWLSLFKGKVEITRFDLVRPVVNLEIDTGGRNNWALAPAAVIAAEGNTPDTASGRIPDISLGKVRFIEGLVRYRDRQSGQAYELSEINAELRLDSLDTPLNIHGSFVFQDEPMSVNLTIADPTAFNRKLTTPLIFKLTSRLFDFDLRGDLESASQFEFDGDSVIDIPSLRELAAWTGSPISGDKGFGPLSLKGHLAAKQGLLKFDNASVSFDGMNGSGSLSVKTSGKRPFVDGRLDVDRLDLAQYESEGTKSETSRSERRDWSDRELDFALLRTFDGDLEISAGSVTTRKLELGKSKIDAKLRNGLLTAELSDFNAYEGTGIGSFTLDARQKAARFNGDIAFNAIQSQPLVKAFLERDALQGVGDIIIQIEGNGASQASIMSGLSGSGELRLNDGKLLGADLAAMLGILSSFQQQPQQENSEQNAEQSTGEGDAQLQEQSGESKATDFVEMGGTFAINNGILSSRDFLLINEGLSLVGDGYLDFGGQTINFRLRPGRNLEDGGLDVSICVRGPWHDISFEIDAEALITDAIVGSITKSNEESALFGAIVSSILKAESQKKKPKSVRDIGC